MENPIFNRTRQNAITLPQVEHTKISQRLHLLRHRQTLLIIDGRLLGLAAILALVLLLLAQIALERDQHQLHPGAVVRDLAHPLALHVLQRVRRVDAEAQHDGVRVVVRQRAQAVEFFLPGRVPERELDVRVVDEDVVDVVFEDGRFAWGRKSEGVGSCYWFEQRFIARLGSAYYTVGK